MQGISKDKRSTFIANCVDHMLEVARIDDNNTNPFDIEPMIKKITELLVEQKISTTKKTYKRYQKLWIDFVVRNFITDEYDDNTLVAFFKSLKYPYSPNTLWVILSCLNS